MCESGGIVNKTKKTTCIVFVNLDLVLMAIPSLSKNPSSSLFPKGGGRYGVWGMRYEVHVWGMRYMYGV